MPHELKTYIAVAVGGSKVVQTRLIWFSTCSPSLAKSADRMLGDTITLFLLNLSTRPPFPLACTVSARREVVDLALYTWRTGEPASPTRLQVVGCILVKVAISLNGTQDPRKFVSYTQCSSTASITLALIADPLRTLC